MSIEPTLPYTQPDKPRRRRPPQDDGLIIVGLTGGMSSGKSTVVRHFADSGAAVIDADRLGHDVLAEAAVRQRLVRAFGDGILDARREVDRRALGRVVFAGAEKLAQLNAISHPLLLERMRGQIEDAVAAGFRGLLVLDAALLVEWDLGSWCDTVVAVTAPLDQRISRAVGQHGIDPDEAGKRIAMQLPDEVRVRYAERTVSNDGTLDDLVQRARVLVEELWAEWRERHETS